MLRLAFGLAVALALVMSWETVRLFRSNGASQANAPIFLPRTRLTTVIFVLAYTARTLVPWAAARLRGLGLTRTLTVLTALLVLAGPGWEIAHRVFFADTRLLQPGHNTYLEVGRWIRIAAVMLEVVVTAVPVLFWPAPAGEADKSGWRAASVGVNLLRWDFGLRCGLLVWMVALELTTPPVRDSFGSPRPSFWFETNSFRVALLLLGLVALAAVLLYRRIRAPAQARSLATASALWSVGALGPAAGVAWLVSLMQRYEWHASLGERESAREVAIAGGALTIIAGLAATWCLLRSFETVAANAGDDLTARRAAALIKVGALLIALALGTTVAAGSGFPSWLVLIGLVCSGLVLLSVLVLVALVLWSLHAALLGDRSVA